MLGSCAMTVAPRLLLALFSLAAVLSIRTALAEACSGPSCWPGSLVPAESGARIPANLPGVLWRSMVPGDDQELPEPSQVELVEVGGDASIPLVATERDVGEYELALGAALTVGSSYRLVDRSTCEESGEPGPEVTFEAAEPAPLPGPSDSLGTLRVIPEGIGPLEVATGIGSCFSVAQSDRVRVELEPSDAVTPWLAALEFETRVGGEVWSAGASINDSTPVGQSWIGRGRDLVYVACASDDGTVVGSGAAQGTHVVAMSARLPGTRVPLVTAEVEITLSCDAASEPGDDGAGEEEGSDDEGGCAAGRSSSGAGAAAAALLLGMAWSRRRRRS